MAGHHYCEQASKLVKAAITEAGYELIEVKWYQEHGQHILGFVIDKRGGISLDDCEVVSNLLSPILDATDLIKEVYNLEVESPGIDRPLVTAADFARYEGTPVVVTLYRQLNGIKKLYGYLGELEGERFLLLLAEELLERHTDKKALKSFYAAYQTTWEAYCKDLVRQFANSENLEVAAANKERVKLDANELYCEREEQVGKVALAWPETLDLPERMGALAKVPVKKLDMAIELDLAACSQVKRYFSFADLES